MLEFLMANLGTLIVGAVVLIIVLAIIYNMVKKKKSGNVGCGCGCEHCSGHCKY